MSAGGSSWEPEAAPASWLAEVRAVYGKDWRCEFRTRYALNTIALFALSTLVVVSVSLGPLGTSGVERVTVLPVVLWIILLFAAAAGLPRSFVHEEESRTAVALRMAATPSALYCAKVGHSLTLLAALEALVAPLFLGMVQLEVDAPAAFAAALALGGYGLAAGSTLVAAIIAQAQGKGTLFSVLSFPILLPLLLMVIELTRAAAVGDPPGPLVLQIVLYDAAVTVAGLMLFPVVWNP